MSTDAAFPFLALPNTVGDRIYRMLVPTFSVIKARDSSVLADQRPGTIMLVFRQVHREASGIYHGANTFSIAPGWRLEDDFLYLRLSKLDAHARAALNAIPLDNEYYDTTAQVEGRIAEARDALAAAHLRIDGCELQVVMRGPHGMLTGSYMTA